MTHWKTGTDTLASPTSQNLYILACWSNAPHQSWQRWRVSGHLPLHHSAAAQRADEWTQRGEESNLPHLTFIRTQRRRTDEGGQQCVKGPRACGIHSTNECHTRGLGLKKKKGTWHPHKREDPSKAAKQELHFRFICYSYLFNYYFDNFPSRMKPKKYMFFKPLRLRCLEQLKCIETWTSESSNACERQKQGACFALFRTT